MLDTEQPITQKVSVYDDEKLQSEVRTMGVYTRLGDEGMTDLLNHTRVSKEDERIVLLGFVDELTSQLGAFKSLGPFLQDSFKDSTKDITKDINSLQEILIQVMGLMANQCVFDHKRLQITPSLLQAQVIYFEKEIDRLGQKQEGFILPGDSFPSALLDIARTTARKVERQCLHLLSLKLFPDEGATHLKIYILPFFNRLSDYLYTLARLDFKSKERTVMPSSLPANFVKTEKKPWFLTLARLIGSVVEETAIQRGCAVVICIMNSQGRLALQHVMDDAYIVSIELASKKAYTSAALKMPTHELGHLTAPGADFEGLETMVSEPIITLGGGYPLIYQGVVIGAIGVSGGTVEQDIALAAIGAELLERI